MHDAGDGQIEFPYAAEEGSRSFLTLDFKGLSDFKGGGRTESREATLGNCHYLCICWASRSEVLEGTSRYMVEVTVDK